jgi:hypothetical protein
MFEIQIQLESSPGIANKVRLLDSAMSSMSFARASSDTDIHIVYKGDGKTLTAIEVGEAAESAIEPFDAYVKITVRGERELWSNIAP